MVTRCTPQLQRASQIHCIGIMPRFHMVKIGFEGVYLSSWRKMDFPIRRTDFIARFMGHEEDPWAAPLKST